MLGLDFVSSSADTEPREGAPVLVLSMRREGSVLCCGGVATLQSGFLSGEPWALWPPYPRKLSCVREPYVTLGKPESLSVRCVITPITHPLCRFSFLQKRGAFLTGRISPGSQ